MVFAGLTFALALGTPSALDSPTATRLKPHVAILRVGGDASSTYKHRKRLKRALADHGIGAEGLGLTLSDMTSSDCRGELTYCASEIGRRMSAKWRTRYDYVVAWAVYEDDGAGEIAVYDFAAEAVVIQHQFVQRSDDLILPLALPVRLAREIHDLRAPPGPLTPGEEEAVRRVVGPTIRDHYWEMYGWWQRWNQGYATRGVELLPRWQPPKEADLRMDFSDFCRMGARQGREDLRPRCKAGPAFGYFRPASWTLLGLTSAAATAGSASYLASLGLQGDAARRARLSGHLLAGATAVLFGSLLGIVAVERRQARAYIFDLKVRAYEKDFGADIGVALHF